MKYGANTEQWLQKNNKKYSEDRAQLQEPNETNMKHNKDKKKLLFIFRKRTKRKKLNDKTSSHCPPNSISLIYLPIYLSNKSENIA